MVVADAVLVDVVHGEAAGLPVVVAVARALDGAVARRLHHGEDDGLRLRAEAQPDQRTVVFVSAQLEQDYSVTVDLNVITGRSILKLLLEA